MVLYGGRFVAISHVVNIKGGGTMCQLNMNQGPPSQLVPYGRTEIKFKIICIYDDNALMDQGMGRFEAKLYVMRDELVKVDDDVEILGNGHDNGEWDGEIVLKHTMKNPMEIYHLNVKCMTRDTSGGCETEDSRSYICYQELGYIGDFTLDYIPLSIIYCPPGQDMTNSLSHSIAHGNRFTIGNSSTFQSVESSEYGMSYKGFEIVSIGMQDSQTTENSAIGGIEIREFRNTVITADNQRAIGRKYWGPLGDIFMIMINPSFSLFNDNLTGIDYYELKDCEEVLLVPAHKLLRPGDDPVVSLIPSEERKKLLELDPFIRNLDLFFPVDTGADISVAANPYKDPTENYRAEPIGLWYLSAGTELNYQSGKELRLMVAEGQEITYASTFKSDIIVMGGRGIEEKVSIQCTKEVTKGNSQSASCYLIRNQNDSDFDAIKLYFDKNFGTIMFRKILTTPLMAPYPLDGGMVTEADFGVTNSAGGLGAVQYDHTIPGQEIPYWVIEEIIGIIQDNPHDPSLDITSFDKITEKGFLDPKTPDLGLKTTFPYLSTDQINVLVPKISQLIIPNKSLEGVIRLNNLTPVFHESVRLVVKKVVIQETVTDGMGRFRFDNLYHGNYSVVIGDKTSGVKVEANNLFSTPKIIKIQGLKRIIELNKCPVWKLRAITGLTSKNIKSLIEKQHIYSILDEQDFVSAIQISKKEFVQLKENIIFRFSGKKLATSEFLSKDNIESLEKIKILTTQQLWSFAKKEKRILEIAEKTGIKHENLMNLVEKIEETRVINQDNKQKDKTATKWNRTEEKR